MIAVVDYGVGNLFSLCASLSKLGEESEIVSSPSNLKKYEKIILPGVGAFGDAAEKLEKSGLGSEIKKLAKEGVPLLGICLGMQLLFEESFEYGTHAGLALLKGKICPLAEDTQNLIIPHMGWNSLNVLKQSPILKYTSQGDFVYFVHSYYAKNCRGSIIATADYGVSVPAVVGCGNVFGTQFHPEKSGETGLKILKAFAEL